MFRKNLVTILLVVVMATCVLAMDPPLYYWNFDEADGTTAADVNGGLTGEWVGTTRWAPEAGKYGGAIECADDSSFIAVNDAIGIFSDLGSEFTFSVWVQVYEFTSDWQGIIFQNDRFFLERNNSAGNGTVNGIHFKVKDETGAQPFNLYGDILIDDGYWHQVVGIYDVDMAYLYVDGVMDKEGPASGEFVGFVEDPLLIGAKFESTYRNSWNGLIDDVRIYNYALNAEQVDSLFNMEISSKVAQYPNQVSTFALAQNYPNPFNPTTTISYSLPHSGNVRLSIYDMLGKEIVTLVDEFQSTGTHQAVWNGTDQFNNPLSSGVYLYQLQMGTEIQKRKMILMK